MTEAFFKKIRETTISNWSLSSLMLEDTDTESFPLDWKWDFRQYITSLEYVGSTAADEDGNKYEDWSMSPLSHII
jgi:hypothetical protein